MKQIVAVSRGKKKNPRSAFLSALMKALGGDTGDAVANAFSGTDPEAFKSAMGKVVDKVAESMPNAST